MLTVVIEARDQAEALARTLASLVSGAVEGMVREVLVHDIGSSDGSDRVAEHAGCHVVSRGGLREGLRRAKGEWLLILKPGARLTEGWIEAVRTHASEASAPARFKENPGVLQRLRALGSPPAGLLIRRDEALALLPEGRGLATLTQHVRAKRLDAGIILPASR